MNKATAVREADLQHLWHPWSPLNSAGERLVLTDGRGSHVRDDHGRTFLDLRAGTLNATVGYSHPRVVQALAEQAGRLMTWDLAEVTTPPPAELAQRIASLLPPPLGRTLFCNSGSEATEAALKIARMWHGIEGSVERTVVLSYADGYHGATAAAIATTASSFRREGSGPLPDGYAHLATPRCAACASGTGHTHCRVPGSAEWEEQILAIGPENIAAILVEPVLSVGGVIVPPPGRLLDLRRLCNRYGMLLIVDEVATGFGRTGRTFGFEHDLDPQAAPDIVTTSKGLAGGYAPLAAVTVREDIYAVFARDRLLGGLRHGHTTGGHTTACAAALAVLDVIEEESLVAAAADRGSQLLSLLSVLSECAQVREVRGCGLIIGVEMASVEMAARVSRVAQDAGVLVRGFGPVLTVAPPLTISKDEAAHGAGVLIEAVRATSRTVVRS
ncbi:aminotransferase family protein [Streptomyces prunicolor]|uniref:aminotransferase family protein n=1 Tax=Streptomyces prunicolor TaxID=67348 RepID=UPI000365B2AB|nr:aspartate aminotransferase family protein [Streptomyces prunicolor]